MEQKNRSTLALKGIALVLGILLWLFVTNENVIITRHTVSDVPVKAVGLGAGLKAVYTDTVDLEITGQTIAPSAFDASINLSGMGAGKYKVAVNVKPPNGVKLVRVVPSRITVNIVEMSEKVVTASARVAKAPPSGFHLTGMLVSPSQVLVRGGYPDLRRVAEVVASVDLSQEKEARALPVQFVPVDNEGQAVENVTVVPHQGQAYVVVEPEKESQKVTLQPQITGSVASGYEIGTVKLDPETVTAFGSHDVISTLTQVFLEPIDVEGQTANLVKEVNISPVAGVVFYPSTVVVSIEIKPVSEGSKP